MEKSEYEIQHFGFSAKQISLERKHIVNKFLSSVLDELLEKLTISPETKQLLVEQKERVHTNMHAALAPDLQKLEAIDNKYFSIPKHVLLPQYFEHANDISEDEERALDEEIAKLKQNFLENSIMMKSIQMENEQYETIQPFVEDELKLQERIRASTSGNLDINSVEKILAVAKTMNSK